MFCVLPSSSPRPLLCGYGPKTIATEVVHKRRRELYGIFAVFGDIEMRSTVVKVFDKILYIAVGQLRKAFQNRNHRLRVYDISKSDQLHIHGLQALVGLRHLEFDA